jgi:hypothetical protein
MRTIAAPLSAAAKVERLTASDAVKVPVRHRSQKRSFDAPDFANGQRRVSET